MRNQVRQGANVIKMMATGGMFTPTANPRKPQYSAETLAAAVREAERSGVQIVAHALAADGVQNCVDAGIHNVIHARWYDQDFDADELDYRPDVVKKMADEGRWVDPTIGHHLLGVEAREKFGAPPATTHWAVSKKNIPEEQHLERMGQMLEAGVRFTSGLDMGMIHASHDLSAANAWAFVEWLGWSNWRAIKACTVDTAEAVRVGDIVGQVKPGMVADLAAFDGDPAQDIRDLRIASTVVQAGKVVKLHDRALV